MKLLTNKGTRLDGIVGGLMLDSHRGSFASNLEQVANLLLCSGQLSLLPWAGREMSSSLQAICGEGLVWLIGALVCLLAAPKVQLFAEVGNGWPHSALRYIISSCQSAAASEIVKRFWSRTRVRSAMTSITTFTFTVYLHVLLCVNCTDVASTSSSSR